ncbi:Bardet-Biedl syndrome 1 protein [Phlyctochytrium bullatum]|nr:Bardet-Biedl syndrome 1 protein [Phlyctochytrium bullatum]
MQQGASEAAQDPSAASPAAPTQRPSRGLVGFFSRLRINANTSPNRRSNQDLSPHSDGSLSPLSSPSSPSSPISPLIGNARTTQDAGPPQPKTGPIPMKTPQPPSGDGTSDAERPKARPKPTALAEDASAAATLEAQLQSSSNNVPPDEVRDSDVIRPERGAEKTRTAGGMAGSQDMDGDESLEPFRKLIHDTFGPLSELDRQRRGRDQAFSTEALAEPGHAATSSTAEATPHQLLAQHLAQDRQQTVDRHNAFWLHSLNAPQAGIRTFSQCMCLTSVDGSGEHELAVAEVGDTPSWLLSAVVTAREERYAAADLGIGVANGRWGGARKVTGRNAAKPPHTTPTENFWLEFKTKLKCFRGNHLVSESTLPVPPTALVSFHADATQTPLLALASGASLYLYRQRRPYFRFTLPNIAPDPLEAEVWRNLADAVNAFDECREMNERALAEGIDPTVVPKAEVDPVVMESAVSRLTELREGARGVLMRRSRRVLAVGVEDREEVVRKWAKQELVIEFQLSSPVAFVSAWGAYEGSSYKIAAACRDNHIYLLAPDVCYRIIQLEVPACGLVLFEHSIVVGCLNRMVFSYHLKGRLLFSRTMPAAITALTEAVFPERSFFGYVAALANGEVRVYDGDRLVTAVYLNSPAVAIKFGTFTREPGALVMVQKDGGLVVKILKRTANLAAPPSMPQQQTPVEEEVPIPVPRKTKLFVEQMNREKRKPGEIYNDFQRDLAELRDYVDRKLGLVVEKSLDPEKASEAPKDHCLRMELELTGLGPHYLLAVTLRNIGKEHHFLLVINVIVNPEIHSVDPPSMFLYVLPSQTERKRYFRLKCIDKVSAGTVEVALCDGSNVQTAELGQTFETPLYLKMMQDIPAPVFCFEDG